MGLMDAPEAATRGFPWVKVLVGIALVVGLMLLVLRMSGNG